MTDTANNDIYPPGTSGPWRTSGYEVRRHLITLPCPNCDASGHLWRLAYWGHISGSDTKCPVCQGTGIMTLVEES